MVMHSRSELMGRNSGGGGHSKADMDNYSCQLNPENDAYWQSRGYDGRPDDDDDEIIIEEFGYSGCCD